MAARRAASRSNSLCLAMRGDIDILDRSVQNYFSTPADLKMWTGAGPKRFPEVVGLSERSSSRLSRLQLSIKDGCQPGPFRSEQLSRSTRQPVPQEEKGLLGRPHCGHIVASCPEFSCEPFPIGQVCIDNEDAFSHPCGPNCLVSGGVT